VYLASLKKEEINFIPALQGKPLQGRSFQGKLLQGNPSQSGWEKTVFPESERDQQCIIRFALSDCIGKVE
jgi:hypothetical protein